MTHPNQNNAHAEAMQLITGERHQQNDMFPDISGWDKFPMEWAMIAQKQAGLVANAQLRMCEAALKHNDLDFERWRARYMSHLVSHAAVVVAWIENELLLEQDRANNRRT